MHNSRSIYYMDIENQDLYFFKHKIENLGHRISIYRNGQKMIEDLNKDEIKPDIFLLSSHMPMVNGKELIAVLKNSENLKDIPVVVIANAFPKKLLRQYMSYGVSYLLKRSDVNEHTSLFKEVLQLA